MRFLTPLPLLFLLTAPTFAQNLSPTEAEVLPRILSAVRVDLMKDTIGPERAVLLRSAGPDTDMADLLILAGDPDERAGQVLVVARNLVWAGLMGGQVPSLDVSAQGSLLVKSEQTGIGRSPWEQTLTLAERDGELRVAGYTFGQWDRLTAGTAVCDWNLLTGSWTMSFEVPSETGPGRKGETSGQRAAQIAVSDWRADADMMPDFCQVDLGD